MLYEIALTLVPGIGDKLGKKLIAYCGSAEAVFRESRRKLQKIPRIGTTISSAINEKDVLSRSEKELEFVQKFQIRILHYLQEEYPMRLKQCSDGPMILYYKGVADLNHPRILSVVGTRSATHYGKFICQTLMEGIKETGVTIVSGLAYGIDSAAHRSALLSGLPTIGVLGHGLDRIYPYANRGLAQKMLATGGLLTDFLSETKPDRENFPKRNRIIAGLCDTLVVVEAAETGGALITADIANSYNRDVLAIPGRVGDRFSAGCNRLITRNQAALIQTAEDLLNIMGWNKDKTRQGPPQRQLMLELTAEEERIISFLNDHSPAHIDDLCSAIQLPPGKVAAPLLHLEFEGLVKAMPGNLYAPA
ncbi:MAG: DNA-protecting protein DprA [Bacteroidetes bacterium]|nr:DNA-protecting protein DprA [Bacteroidota bacterium]